MCRLHVHQPNPHFSALCNTFGHPTRTISLPTIEPGTITIVVLHTFGLPTRAISAEGHVSINLPGAEVSGEKNIRVDIVGVLLKLLKERIHVDRLHAYTCGDGVDDIKDVVDVFLGAHKG